jgi:hypothetical protein
MHSVESQLKFRKKISSQSSGSENKPTGFFLGLFFDPENGSDMSVDFQLTTRLISQKIYLFPTTFRMAGTTDSFSEVKRQEREAECPSLFSAEVNIAW